MNDSQARAYIAQLTTQKGIVLGLEPMRQLLHRLGDPQDTMPFVHIAGTNGKGSTLAMTASMLRAAGYRVGTYSSPAVFCARECWRVDGQMISADEYAAWMTTLAEVRAGMQADGQPLPTAFEMETALAFAWMAQQSCDIAVVECGMGGAEDATNVIRTTAVSVLTSVGMDHMKFLGGTLAEIARAKGGIVKPGVPAVVQGQDAEAEREIADICAAQGSPLTRVPTEDITVTEMDAASVTFDYGSYRGLTVPLSGLFQARNAATAIEAVRQLRGFSVGEDDMRRGLRAVQWPGRMQQICSRPVIVIDGAHNPNAARQLRDSARRRWPEGKVVELVGVLADKDFSEVGHLMAPLAKCIVTVTPPDNPRALDAGALAGCLRQYHDHVSAADSVPHALEQALDAAGPDGAILAFGSLSWLGALRRAVEERGL